MKFALYSAMALFCLCLLACTKDQSSTRFHVRLTDGPTDLDAVNIDLQSVRVKLDSDSAEWVTMETKAGIYNLLDFQNGVDTSIASGNFDKGAMVKEIRLVLGTQNTVVENGDSLALIIPSGSESGLKIKIAKSLRTTMDSLVLDFDAALSVKKEQDGYKLRPVIKLK